VGLIGSRDTTRAAFQRGLIDDGEAWMEMIKSRNLTSHAYDRATADGIYTAILERFFDQFQKLQQEFTRRQQES
jgi:nucleotidyltransferase substrate binding protein (TIGR01987 family)